jgi:hypothetical protein
MLPLDQNAIRYYVKAVYEIDTNLTTGLTVNLNMRGGSTIQGGDYTVDWGDGTAQRYFMTTTPPSKTYTEHGVYQVTIDGLVPALGFSQLGFPSAALLGKIKRIKAWNDVKFNGGFNYFRECVGLIEVPFNNPPTPFFTMQGAFHNCTSFNQQLTWDFSSVITYFNTFLNATSFNQDIGGWQLNTSLTNMTAMLNNCGMSEENYSRTLMGWANQVSLNDGPINVTLGALGRQYSDINYTTGGTFNNGVDARAYLISRGWAITGDTRIDYLLDESDSFILLENNNKLLAEGII